MVNTTHDNRKLTKVKVLFTLRAGMVKVGNQGFTSCGVGIASVWFDHVFGFSATTMQAQHALACKGQFVAELIAFASTSLGAAKVRATTISIPGFADQEQENRTRLLF